MSRRYLTFAVALSTLGLLLAGPLEASETQAYTYDALGRLTQVARNGTVNNGASESYAYDKASNRTNVTVAGAGGGAYPSFAISAASTTEGGSLVFTVTKTGTTTSSFSVNYSTANGTAVSSTDYTAGSGTLTFPAGTASLTVTVPTTDDVIAESTETMTVNLSGATGGSTITTASGTGTITDNDGAPPATFSISNASVTEGGTLTFTVTKTGTGVFTVNYATASGTATSGTDFTAKTGTLTVDHLTSIPISVTTTDDSLVEGNETMTITLSGASGGAVITNSTGTGTIVDND